jgi:hypothetical protein
MSDERRATPLVLVLAAWCVVAAPLGWGLYRSVLKSWPLLVPHEEMRPTSP